MGSNMMSLRRMQCCMNTFHYRYRLLTMRCLVNNLHLRYASNVCNELSGRVVTRMDELGIRKLTDIQEKALPVVLQGQNAIINAETGSGKTLCFLLPIINKLMMNNSPVKPAPFSFVLVPTAELAMQIHSVFMKLRETERPPHCSVVFSSNRLMMTPTTGCVIGTPSSLISYDLKRLFKSTEILAIDEADILLTGGECTATWRILKLFRSSFQTSNHCQKQMMFCGATLPSRGRKSALSSLIRWVPRDTKLIQTSRVHLPPANIEFKFVDVPDEPAKLAELTAVLHDHHLSDDVSVLVFTNSVATCEAVYHSLYNCNDCTHGSVGRLDKTVGIEKRHLTMKMFLEGEINLLVCTDLFARGIDIPNVSLVIIYDFPSNSVDFLHRVGRTARVGKSGKVVSLVLPSEKKLSAIIQHTVTQEHTDFDHIFSRNKMLKRRIDKLLEVANNT